MSAQCGARNGLPRGSSQSEGGVLGPPSLKASAGRVWTEWRLLVLCCRRPSISARLRVAVGTKFVHKYFVDRVKGLDKFGERGSPICASECSSRVQTFRRLA